MSHESDEPRSRSKAVSFNANYQTLKGIAEALRDQKEPDIDALVPMVEEATQAYKVCATRLQAVEQALQAHFSEQTSSGPEPAASGSKPDAD